MFSPVSPFEVTVEAKRDLMENLKKPLPSILVVTISSLFSTKQYELERLLLN